MRSVLMSLLDSDDINNQCVIQSSLSLAYGGLGLRMDRRHTLAAFLSSLIQSKKLITSITHKPDLTDEIIKKYQDKYFSVLNIPQSFEIPSAKIQKKLSSIIDDNIYNDLLDTADKTNKARLNSIKSNYSHYWLIAFPSPQLNQKFNNNTKIPSWAFKGTSIVSYIEDEA